jgi:capsular polysaccharide biosynthesis protein
MQKLTACLYAVVVTASNVAIWFIIYDPSLLPFTTPDQTRDLGDSGVLNINDCDLNSFDIIHNGTIYSDGEVAKDNCQIVDISGGNQHPKARCVLPQDYQRTPIGVLLHSHDSSYYHALIQFGARLKYTMDHCRSKDVIWSIRGSPTQMKILALLNNPPILNTRIFHLSQPQSSVLVLIPPAPYRVPDLIAFRDSLMSAVLHTLATSLFRRDMQDTPIVLYVSRVRTRAIQNEAQVLEVFSAFVHGRHEIFPENEGISFKTTVDIFQRATHVLGGHGAGLANIIFCRPGTHVFEIRRRGTPSELVSDLAPHFGLEGHRFIDPVLPAYQDYLHYSNYTVHISSFLIFMNKTAAAAPEAFRPRAASREETSAGALSESAAGLERPSASTAPEPLLPERPRTLSLASRR